MVTGFKILIIRSWKNACRTFNIADSAVVQSEKSLQGFAIGSTPNYE